MRAALEHDDSALQGELKPWFAAKRGYGGRWGYTGSEAAEAFAGLAPVVFADLRVAGTLLDFPAASRRARA
jgi:hypothetical protein